MYQPILKVYLSLLATLIHGRLGMPTSILLALLSNVKLREKNIYCDCLLSLEQLTAIYAESSVA